jgi:hypothetical protein
MTRSGIERFSRTISRSVDVSPNGSGRSGGVVLRIGLRTLAIAGFAGAAWLLSGGTAHAASDHTTPVRDDSSDLSVVNLVSHLGNGIGVGDATTERSSDSAPTGTPVTDVLSVVTKPVLDSTSTRCHEAPRTADQATATTLPCTTAAHSAPLAWGGLSTSRADGPVDGATPAGTSNGAGQPGQGGLVQNLVAPLDPAHGAAGRSGVDAPLTGVLNPLTTTIINPLDQVLHPVTRVLDPVTRPLAQVTRPLTGALQPITTLVVNGADSLIGAVGRVMAPAALTYPTLPVPNGNADRVSTAGSAGNGQSPTVTATRCAPVMGGQHISSTIGQPAGVESLTATNMMAGGRGTDVPQWPLGAPFGAYPGGGCGSGTTGSGFPTGGGSFALAPYSVANDSVGFHRLRPSTEVEVLRLIAQTPTVSPD